MEFDSNGFYCYNGERIEGPLKEDDSLNELKLVFLLREPNSSKAENENRQAEDFWFRDCVMAAAQAALNGEPFHIHQDTNSKRQGTKYFNTLSMLASLLLREESKADSVEDKLSVLKECAYINLNPVKGNSTKSDGYKAIYDDFFSDAKCEVSATRWQIINALRDGCYLITTEDIFNGFAKIGESEIQKSPIQIEGKRTFRMLLLKISEKTLRVVEFYHPSASFSYEKIKPIKWETE